MTTIYFDESGQTGTHLFDHDQPYFTIGSTDLPEDAAGEIIARCFPRYAAPELKSRQIFRRPRGRAAFLDFARVVGEMPDRFCAAQIGKRFTIVSKMVDNLVEPFLHAQGYDFYADDYARRFANMASFAFEGILERDKANALMERYNAFARAPSKEGLAALTGALQTEAERAPEGVEHFLDLMAEGAKHFETFHDIEAFGDTNEIHVTAVIECMKHWQDQHAGPFDVIHDESIHFFARSGIWSQMTNPAIAPTTIQVGDKVLKLPIPVTSTTSARSHECASLQICDLIAGFVARASMSNPPEEVREFVVEALDAGMGELKVFPVDRGDDFVGGPPELLSGPDAIDRIRISVAQAMRSGPPGETG